MTLSEINNRLLNKIIEDEHAAVAEMKQYRGVIEDFCCSDLKLSSSIEISPRHTHQHSEFLERIQISSLFSDVTKICPDGGFAGYSNKKVPVDKSEILALLNDEFHKEFDLTDDIELWRGISAFRNEEANFLMENCLPLFGLEKLSLSTNDYGLVNVMRDGKKIFPFCLRIEYDAKRVIWGLPKSGVEQKNYPIFYADSDVSKSNLLTEIVVPYLRGISITEFAQIIKDEEGLLSSFRKEVRELINTAKKNDASVQEIYNDCVRPKIETINTKFKSISEIHRFKVYGVTVATAALSLLSMTMGNYIGAASTMLAAATGSAGLVKFESEYKSEMNALKKESLYLLWKLQFSKSMNNKQV